VPELGVLPFIPFCIGAASESYMVVKSNRYALRTGNAQDFIHNLTDGLRPAKRAWQNKALIANLIRGGSGFCFHCLLVGVIRWLSSIGFHHLIYLLDSFFWIQVFDVVFNFKKLPSDGITYSFGSLLVCVIALFDAIKHITPYRFHNFQIPHWSCSLFFSYHVCYLLFFCCSRKDTCRLAIPRLLAIRILSRFGATTSRKSIELHRVARSRSCRLLTSRIGA